MDKVTAFLEKYVEYFVLGIAGLFFLYMTWSYVIISPTTKTVNGKEETPSTIDDSIEKSSLQTLLAATSNTNVPNFGIKADTASLDSILNPSAVPARLANYWPSQPMQIRTEQQGNTTSGTVATLPKLPAAQPLLGVTGRSTIQQPAGSAAASASTPTTDIFWTQVFFAISADQLRTAWNQAFSSAKMNDPSEVLRVVAYRSEKTPTGWSPDTEVPLLPNNTLPAYPDGKDQTALFQYESIANRQAADIVTPPLPSQPAGPAGTLFRPARDLLALLMTPPAPPKPGPGGAALLPTSGFLLVSDELPFGQGRGPQGGARPPGGGGAAGSGARGPENRGPEGAFPPGAGPAAPPVTPTVTRPENTPESLEPRTFPVAGAKPKTLPVAPPGMFNPAAITSNAPDWFVYILDGAAQPGHTYKYRIVYKLLNPLFGKNPSQASDKNWVSQFDIASEISPYSPEIKAPDKTYFFCAKEGTNNQTLPFEVFTWSGGQWRRHTFNVNPGDKIGDKEKESTKDADLQVDYSTGYVFLESTRGRTSKDMASIVDQDGVVSMRDERADVNSVDRKKYTFWADKPSVGGQQPGGGFNPGPEGGPPISGPPISGPPISGPPGGFMPPEGHGPEQGQ